MAAVFLLSGCAETANFKCGHVFFVVHSRLSRHIVRISEIALEPGARTLGWVQESGGQLTFQFDDARIIDSSIVKIRAFPREGESWRIFTRRADIPPSRAKVALSGHIHISECTKTES